jgi:hypothetical protein
VIWRSLKIGLPVAGLELVGVAGAAYLTWEHDQGSHDKPNLMCPICWMDKLVPVTDASAGTMVATAAATSAPTSAEPADESASE